MQLPASPDRIYACWGKIRRGSFAENLWTCNAPPVADRRRACPLQRTARLAGHTGPGVVKDADLFIFEYDFQAWRTMIAGQWVDQMGNF
jgi:hypothetical protein